MAVEVSVLKQLRERTDASVGACKDALEKAQGDIDKAAELLRSEGSRIAEKKSARETGIGIVEAYVHTTQRLGALLELRSETDFVARNAEFQKLAHNIAMHVTAAGPQNVEELLAQPYIRDESKTIQDVVNESIARFGENIQIARFSRFEI